MGFDLSVAANVAGADIWANFTPAATVTVSENESEYSSDMSFGGSYLVGDHTLLQSIHQKETQREQMQQQVLL